MHSSALVPIACSAILSQETHHETFPPQILASGCGRCRAASFAAYRAGATLPVATDTHHRRLGRRERSRYDTTSDGTTTVGTARPAICYGQSPRCHWHT